MSTEHPQTPPVRSPEGMNIVVPINHSTLLVVEAVIGGLGLTSEDRLRHYGHSVLGIPLSLNFGWRDTYITDPILHPSALRNFSRQMYEERRIPEVPDPDKATYEIYDLDEPAVRIIGLIELARHASKPIDKKFEQ